MKRRAFLGGGVAAVAGLAGGPALLDRRGERQVRELSASAVPAAPGRRLGQRRLIWSVSTAEPLAALTFDDGPDPELTPRILEVLAEHGVRATFNVMGWNALRHPDLVRAVVAAGHELGNHTWTHQDLAFQSALQTRRQLEWGREAIERTAGVRPRFFRPPARQPHRVGDRGRGRAGLRRAAVVGDPRRGRGGDPRLSGRPPRPHGRAG